MRLLQISCLEAGQSDLPSERANWLDTMDLPLYHCYQQTPRSSAGRWSLHLLSAPAATQPFRQHARTDVGDSRNVRALHITTSS